MRTRKRGHGPKPHALAKARHREDIGDQITQGTCGHFRASRYLHTTIRKKLEALYKSTVPSDAVLLRRIVKDAEKAPDS